MNENIDLTKILDGCPVGTKLYSPIFGDVEFRYIHEDTLLVYYNNGFNHAFFDKKGKFYDLPNTECTLFPSKDQRNWSKFVRFWDKPKVEKFDINTLQPFDKILVRSSDIENWTIDFYSYGKITSFLNEDKYIQALVYSWRHVIPYNEETKHLVGTNNDCPEYYKWWEK